MSNDTILNTLKLERGQLQQEVEGKQDRIAQLTVAIDALEGKVNAPKSGGPSVPDMIEVATIDLEAPFDHRALVKEAQNKFPGHDDSIQRGVYSAVAKLLRINKIVRIPGGFKRVEGAQAG